MLIELHSLLSCSLLQQDVLLPNQQILRYASTTQISKKLDNASIAEDILDYKAGSAYFGRHICAV